MSDRYCIISFSCETWLLSGHHYSDSNNLVAWELELILYTLTYPARRMSLLGYVKASSSTRKEFTASILINEYHSEAVSWKFVMLASYEC